MKRPAALAAILVLTACGGSSDSRQPDNGPTLPPAGLFKDGLLYAAVKARLAGTDIDSTTRISVVVHDGVVTLSGTVKDAATRDREVNLVRRMHAVKAVNDEVRVGQVGPSAAQTVGDAALDAAVEAELTAQGGVNVAGVKVDVNAGTVTLSGHASTAAVKSTLLEAARQTPGVHDVVDRIAVK
ncbi:MAG: BON domain-containing protein [Candidatus Velthaea sp.]